MDNFYFKSSLDFPVYRKEVKNWFRTLLKIRQIKHTWHNVKNMPYIGYYRIEFFSTSEAFDFFFDMGGLFGVKKEA